MKPTNKRENVLPDLLSLCEKLGRVPLLKEVIEGAVVGCSKTLKGICQENGYDSYEDFCRHYGYGHDSDVYIGGNYRSLASLTLDDYIILWNEFKEKHDRFPTKEDCASRKIYGYNLPPQQRFNDILKYNNISLNNFKDIIGDKNKQAVIGEYDKYVKKYKEISTKRMGYIKYNELTNNTWGLPDARWLINHCPDKRVKSFSNFVEYCGFIPFNEVSKDLAKKTIYNMQEKLDRPLMLKDFYSPELDEIGLAPIIKYWGNLNNMKRELGLEIVQESMMDRQMGFSEMKEELRIVCDEIYKNEKRSIINTQDISDNCSLNYATYYNNFIKNGTTVREFLKAIGYSLQPCGVGVNHSFDDGENTYSRYEYVFSSYLRKNKLKYNVGYFRDVEYRDFTKSYEGSMNCDYRIHYQNRVIYTEIAGFLVDYEKYYYDNMPIKNKSKEEYRKNLKQKEQMLKDNNLEYYIIFPQDCNEEFFNSIFKQIV